MARFIEGETYADDLAEEARRVGEALLRRAVLGVETFAAPKGRVRESVRLRLSDRTVIATKRLDAPSRKREAVILQTLRRHGAPVPRVVAFDGTWLIQQDLGTTRLTEVLNDPARTDGSLWLDRGLGSLNTIHEAARAAGLPGRPSSASARAERLETYFAVFGRLQEKTGVPEPPDLPRPELRQILVIAGTDYIKFDPNPADAIIGKDGTIAFFDWEACQAGCALEDLAKFVCNETVPAELDPLDRLAELCPYAFRMFPDPPAARAYLVAFAALYMARRLNILWGWQQRQGWLDWDQCLAQGLPGVSPRGVENLCRRASQWCRALPLTEGLAPWFETHQAHARAQG